MQVEFGFIPSHSTINPSEPRIRKIQQDLANRRKLVEMHPQPDHEGLVRYFRKDPAFALHTAVVLGDLPRTRELLNSGYDIDKLDDRYPDHYGTPLHVAIWCNQSAAFELLFIRGADFNILDGGGHFRSEDTPIRLAVRLGRRAMFKRLWDAGAERNKYSSVDPTHHSLVEVAAYEGSAHILQDLLSWDQSWTQNERIIALDLACSQWHVDVVATLLTVCQVRFSKTDLEIAMNAAATGPGPFLYERRLEKDEELLTLEENSLRQAGILILLLDEHARVEGAAGGSAAYDCSELLNGLLGLVSDSPFNIAALKLLLKRGADPNSQSAGSGSTPLHRALGWRRDLRRCNEEGVIALLDHKARVDIQDNLGETAIDKARKIGYTAIVQKLMQHSRNNETTGELPE